MKKWVSFLLVLVFTTSLVTTVQASDDSAKLAIPNVSTLDFTYIEFTSCSLNISGAGLAECDAAMLCLSAIDKVRISTYLQRYDNGWVTVQHWAQNTYDNYAYLNNSYNVISGIYRYYCYYYAYIDGSVVESTTLVVYDSY